MVDIKNIQFVDTILVFIDWYLPGTNAGGPVRSVANVVDHLGGEFHFSIITRNNDYCSMEPYPGIAPDGWTALNDHTRVCYLSPGKVSCQNLRKLIRDTSFDVAWINGIYSWSFSILPLFLLKRSRKRIVVSSRGMMNRQAFTSGKLKKKFFITLARWSGLYKGVKFHATNEDEKKNILQQLGKDAQVIVAPNLPTKLSRKSEESSRNCEIGREENLQSDKQKSPGSLKLLSVARISPEKGTLHALHLLKGFKKGNIQFDLYGPVYNESYWEACREVIASLPSNVTFAWHGPAGGEQIRKALSDAHFLLMLSEGENFGHSILEALSEGVPVIISDRTPWRNLEDKKAGFDLPLEDRPAFVRTLDRALAMDGSEWQEWSAGASALAFEYADNESNVEASRKMLSEK